MENNQRTLLAFLENNQDSSKASISNATGIKGLQLFNLLRKMVNEGQVFENSEGDEVTYSTGIAGPAKELPDDEMDNAETIGDTSLKEGASVPAENNQTPVRDEKLPVPKSTGRDSSKFIFDGGQHGKGPLVRAVVAKYVEDHKDITYEQLKSVFPDALLKRFGIFQQEAKAREIAGKGNRYFTKPGQVITLADCSVVVCNQFTAENIQPFLKTARGLGYEIS